MRDQLTNGTAGQISPGFLRENRRFLGPVIAVAVLLVSLLIANSAAEPQEFPADVAEKFHFVDAVNGIETWLKKNVRWLTKGVARGIGQTLDTVETFLLLLPWQIVIIAIALPALKFGGLRLAIFCVLASLLWAGMDMWDPSMQTLGLMAVSVTISVVVGVALGVVCSQSNTVQSVVRPVLDTMQTMPAFVYLIPAIFFFGIGGPPAVMATVIYALPPAARLTNLGIRQVPSETIEAATSFGTTRWQLLWKVLIPLAMPSIMMGINQTVMMALGVVVLATFIGAAGLGYEVWQALRTLKVGWGFEGGLSIVLMAIMFDRVSAAMSGREGLSAQQPDAFRLLPQKLDTYGWARLAEHWLDCVCRAVTFCSRLLVTGLAHLISLPVRLAGAEIAENIRAFVLRHWFFAISVVILLTLYLVDKHLTGLGSFPSSWELSMRKPVDQSVKWLASNDVFIGITTGVRTTVFLYLLDPLADFLVALPWWYVIGLVCALVWFIAGPRLAALCLGSLLFIGAAGLWGISMFTMASILVSVFLCFLIGVPIGVFAAYSDTFDAFLKPILDAMQTLPAFVYLIPVLMFFGGNVVSAVIATLIYALPPMVRLTTLGVRGVPNSAVEAARSFGSTLLQTLLKVRLPLALPSLMMGVNQAVMMALAMTVITPLIGGGGLGREVFTALNVANTGLGLQAGLCIVFLAIVLDRFTQSWSLQRQKALGI